MKRNRQLWSVALLAALASVAPALTGIAEAEFQQARKLLTGERKDPVKAKQLLLDLVQTGKAVTLSDELTAYVYLGYIEDREGRRDAAVAWFRKALAVPVNSPGIQAVAREGLSSPVTFIRHLDEGVPAAPPKPKMAKGYITEQPPPGLVPAKNLSAKERRENFDAVERDRRDLRVLRAEIHRLEGGRTAVPAATGDHRQGRRVLPDDVPTGQRTPRHALVAAKLSRRGAGIRNRAGDRLVRRQGVRHGGRQGGLGSGVGGRKDDRRINAGAAALPARILFGAGVPARCGAATAGGHERNGGCGRAAVGGRRHRNSPLDARGIGRTARAGDGSGAVPHSAFRFGVHPDRFL